MTKGEFIWTPSPPRANLSKKGRCLGRRRLPRVGVQSLRKGEDVAFTGFGKFHVQHRKARTGVNPRSGAKVEIPAGKVPKFSAGSSLKSAVK